jgi:hypothetical protein
MTEWVGVLMLLLGQVTVNVAPDQPLPHVFDDDPLILEFIAEKSGNYSATIRLEVDGHPSQRVELNGMPLKADKPYWHSLTDVDPLLGPHEVKIDVTDSSGESNQVNASFYRIHRPDPEQSYPLTVHLDHLDEALLARHLPAKTLRVEQPISTWNDWVTLTEYHQIKLEVCVDPTQKEWTPIRLETAANRLKDRIDFWVIGPSDNTQSILKAAQAIRRGDRNARMALAVIEPNDILDALVNTAGVHFEKLVVRSSNFPPEIYRSMLERFGEEALALDYDLNYTAKKPWELLDTWIQCLRVGAQPVIHQKHLQNQTGLAQSFSMINAWVRGFSRVQYAGPVTDDTNETHALFRIRGVGGPRNHWMLVAPQSSDSEIHSLLNPSSTLDSHFNKLNEPTTKAIGRFLIGEGAEALTQASWNRVVLQVDAILGEKPMMSLLSEPIQSALNTLGSGNGKSSHRRELFQLLQALPTLDAGLREGSAPKALAIPLSSRLGTIAEGLALLEESLGEPFLEPLSKILAQCADYQSRYITLSGGMDDKPRSLWLLKEVNRLLSRVDTLQQENRVIEATAIATLAEWRARSLISTP